MKCLRLLSLSTILLAISGCSMGDPEESMEFPLQHRDWHVESPVVSLQWWCAGLCPDYEALR
jgi:hypothetical protein